jgi:Gpi18-like mannosyltransferase
VALRTHRPLSEAPTGAPSAVCGWTVAALAFVVSRLGFLAVVTAASEVHSSRPLGGFIKQWLTHFDGVWFLSIAAHGYGFTSAGGQTNYPFFPLLPALMRVGGELGVSHRTTGLVVANLSFLAALAGMWTLVTPRWGAQVGKRAVWAMALFPASFTFSMLYSDGLFLAGTIWAFVAAEKRSWWCAGAAATAAVLSRPNGVLVVLPLAVAYLFAERRLRWSALSLGLPLSALAAFMAYLWAQSGDPFRYLTAKSAWSEVSLVSLVERAVTGETIPNDVVAHLAVAAPFLVLLVWGWRRIPLPWVIFAGLVTVLPFGFGLLGMARYTAAAFPIYVLVALVVRPGRALEPAYWTFCGLAGSVLCAAVALGMLAP